MIDWCVNLAVTCEEEVVRQHLLVGCHPEAKAQEEDGGVFELLKD